LKKILNINIDPNGVCNAKCWFCPVAYLGNPKENVGVMSLETMENIFKQLDSGRGDWVEEKIYNTPIHFNEVLLYPHFEEMLELHKKYNISMGVYTNGVNLTRDKTNLIKKYKSTVSSLILNVPSLNEKQWSEFTGFNIKLFPKLLDNLKYAEEQLVDLFPSQNFSIMVNGINEKSLFKNGGTIDLLEKAPHYDLNTDTGTLAKIVEEMKTFLPRINIWGRNNLGDRTSILEKLSIISNQSAIKEKNKGKVIKCSAGFDETLYISATGNMYICCVDFSYETVYANIKDRPIKEIWHSVERKKALKKAYEALCTDCVYGVRDIENNIITTKVI
jgi:radical SAM protein with 4Fe4S-binding SPASM domain